MQRSSLPDAVMTTTDSRRATPALSVFSTVFRKHDIFLRTGNDVILDTLLGVPHIGLSYNDAIFVPMPPVHDLLTVTVYVIRHLHSDRIPAKFVGF